MELKRGVVSSKGTKDNNIYTTTEMDENGNDIQITHCADQVALNSQKPQGAASYGNNGIMIIQNAQSQ